MSGKIRSFTVAAFAPVASPFGFVAHSKLQLGRRLAEALHVAPDLVTDAADVLWRGNPVYLFELGVSILPVRFSTVSYQMLEQRALAS